jgi:uncharacterized protein (DUF1501 family)
MVTSRRNQRRRFLKLATLAGAGLMLGDFLRLEALAGSANAATADSCILIFLNGGMSHVDTFDPKPDQPAHIRGEFKTIATSAPGLLVTEQWPLLARLAHLWAVVRTVTFEIIGGNHSPACYHMLTGVQPVGESAVLAPPRPTDQPALGSVVAKLRPTPTNVPAYVMVPDVLIENQHLTPGQFAGWLGSRYEAFRVVGDPSVPAFAVPALARPADMQDVRLAERHALLQRLEALRPALGATPAVRDMDPHYERAFGLLTGTRAQAAFDIAAEPITNRERYGMNKFGQSVLVARRMVEAGVRFVNVHWPNVGGGANWDTHDHGFVRLKRDLIPPTDRALSALLNDLHERGRLRRTLVVLMTEFGRTPVIGQASTNGAGKDGRDHWSRCFSVLLAGGGIRGGQVYGASDAKGAYPGEKPVRPCDIVATAYHALGINAGFTLTDSEGRTHPLCDGKHLGEMF